MQIKYYKVVTSSETYFAADVDNSWWHSEAHGNYTKSGFSSTTWINDPNYLTTLVSKKTVLLHLGDLLPQDPLNKREEK